MTNEVNYCRSLSLLKKNHFTISNKLKKTIEEGLTFMNVNVAGLKPLVTLKKKIQLCQKIYILQNIKKSLLSF